MYLVNKEQHYDLTYSPDLVRAVAHLFEEQVRLRQELAALRAQVTSVELKLKRKELYGVPGHDRG
jgi:hypothetical protein